MEIRLNGQKTKGFYLDKSNDIKIPFNFLFWRGIHRHYKAFFAALVKMSLLKKTLSLNENDLAKVLEGVGVRMNQDLLKMLSWFEKRDFLKVEKL